MTTPSSDDVLNADLAAADWFVAHDRGLTDSERLRFEEWRNSSLVNREAWLHAQRVMAAFPRDDADLLADLRQEALTFRPAPIWRRWPAAGAAIAAALVLAVGVTSWKQIPTLTGTQQQTAKVASIKSSYAARARTIEVALEDGSHVQMDAHTDLDVHLSAGRRDLTLRDGRAFFSVAHDTSRPFVVAADGMTVTATGTAFAVSVSGQRLSVVLETGHVRIAGASGGSPPIELNPGQEYRVDNGRASVATTDVDSALAWRQGLIVFSDTPIKDALRELNRYSQVKVSVADGGAGSLRVTGRFPYDNAPAFAEALASMYPVHVEHLRDGSQAVATNRR